MNYRQTKKIAILEMKPDVREKMIKNRLKGIIATKKAYLTYSAST